MTLKSIFQQSKDFRSYAHSYGKYIAGLLEELDTVSLERLVEGFQEAREKNKTIFIIGNGGSAATASHMANDLGFGARGKIEFPFKVISLTDNFPVMTATANDWGYDQIFLRQLQVYYTSGDKLLVISASGNSPNLVLAAEWVKGQGGEVLGFLGFDGGKLKGLCDVSVVVKTPKGEYGPVEDVHMILDHLMTNWFYSRNI